MTATAFAFDPALDFFDDVEVIAPERPQLRLINGEGSGRGFGQIVPNQPMAPVVSIEVYRRRRFLVLIAVTVLVLAMAWATGLSVLSFGGSGAALAAEEAPAVHVVLPGDSYAAIAADLGVANPVDVAEQLRAANGGSELVVGQRLVVDLAAMTAGG